MLVLGDTNHNCTHLWYDAILFVPLINPKCSFMDMFYDFLFRFISFDTVLALVVSSKVIHLIQHVVAR